MTKISMIILAGGKSRRFGRDKSVLKIDRSLIVATIVEECRKLSGGYECDEILLVSNAENKFGLPGTTEISDIFKEVGPLGGVHSGLSHAANRDCFVIACDMPCVTHQMIELILDHREDNQVVLPCVGQHMEPMFGYYRRDILPVVTAMLERDEVCILDVYPQVRTRYLYEDIWGVLPDSELVFYNINFPEDYENFKRGDCNHRRQRFHKRYYREFCERQKEEGKI